MAPATLQVTPHKRVARATAGVGLRLFPEQLEVVDRICAEQGVSRSDVMRHGLQFWIDQTGIAA
jgi:hypothetical protein